ncbi:MAG TPA: chemotaxis protein CheB, partial [Xanthomonadaceae bacterium]|nr:chemotaxis protein CheB [Xanthomonadaceae bacterium]
DEGGAEGGDGVDEAAGAPRQLWVLGGALGGPEAITQFLNALPDRGDTAFLIVIHFDRGNAESYARSLGASGRRRVGVAGQGECTRVDAGGVVLAPEGSRVRVDRDGAVRVETLDSPVGVIDQCARAAADAFGMDAGIILFSGGARDGFEGALYVAQRGGVVWAQDPATCVAGGMAETVRGRGIATFIGSPRALAEHFVQEFG